MDSFLRSYRAHAGRSRGAAVKTNRERLRFRSTLLRNEQGWSPRSPSISWPRRTRSHSRPGGEGRRKAWWPNLFGALGLVLATACGERAKEMERGPPGAQQDASTEDGSADGSFPSNDGPAPTCSERPGSCPARPIAEWKVLLAAADFGAGARLIALGGQAVLVALDDGSFQVALIDDNHDALPTTTYSSWPLPSATRRPIGSPMARMLPAT
jgi:hypothetical protein